MSSEHIGIEDARKVLGDLVTKAQDGTGIVLTRHGKPAARIIGVEEPPTPTMLETLATYRRFATVDPVRDTLGLDARDPAGWKLSVAEVECEAAPFAALIKDIDAFFGDDLESALTGDEAAAAEAEVRRIVAENLATVTVRLALTTAAGAQIDWTSANAEMLQLLARTAMKRAADQRFVEIVQSLHRP